MACVCDAKQKRWLFILVALSSLRPTQSLADPETLLERTRRQQPSRLVKGRLKRLHSLSGEEAHAKVKALTAMLAEAIGEAAWYDAGGPEADSVELVTKPPPGQPGAAGCSKPGMDRRHRFRRVWRGYRRKNTSV